MQYGVALDSSTKASQDQRQFFTFIVKEQEYGVDILRIQEIRGWTGVRHLPTMPSFIKGVIDLRGVVVPVIDLRQRFGLEPRPYSQLTVVVVLKVKSGDREQIMGLIVDAVSEVYDIESSQLQASPEFGTGVETTFVQHLATINGKMVILLDVDKLLEIDNIPEHIAWTENASATNAEVPTTRGATSDASKTETSKKDTPTRNTKSQSPVDLLEQSFAAIAPNGTEFVTEFYDELFQRHPDVKPMFKNTTISEQKKKLLTALQVAISQLRHPDKLRNTLNHLGRKHQDYGALPAHYDAVAAVLLDVIKKFNREIWNEDVRQAWKSTLGTVKQFMLEAYEKEQPDIEEKTPQRQNRREAERSNTRDDELSSKQISLIEKSFYVVAPRADEMAAKFYGTLFRTHPEVKPMFANVDPKEQKKKLLTALKFTVQHLRTPEKLAPALRVLGRKHQQYGAADAHYDVVAGILLSVMSEVAGEKWTADIEKAWTQALGYVKEKMLAGYT